MKQIFLILSIGIGLCIAASLFAEPSRPLPPPRIQPPIEGLANRDRAMPLPWLENFESGGAGWTTVGFFHVVANPELQTVMTPTINPNLVTLPDAGNLPAAYGGTHDLWYGEDATGTFLGADFDITQPLLSGGTSQMANTGYAITPELDLSTVADATLSFWTWWEVEGVDVPWYDVMLVDISLDAGATWMPIGSGILNPLNDVNANANVGYSSGGVGAPGIWVHHLFSLAGYTGGSCWIRFSFDTVDQLYNGFRGWFLDDVLVESSTGTSAPIITDVVPPVGQAGDLVHVQGENFQNGAQIMVGGFDAEEVILSDMLAQVIIPSLELGEYDVQLTNPDGQFDICSNCFEITEALEPELDNVYPDWTYLGTSEYLVLTGHYFNPSAVVFIGGQSPTDVLVVNSEIITCNSPITLGIGFHAVRVENPDGQFDQCVGCFEVRVPIELMPPDDLVISAQLPHILLNWNSVPGENIRYHVYRDLLSDGTFSDMIGNTSDTSFVDSNAANSSIERQFYIVRTFTP